MKGTNAKIFHYNITMHNPFFFTLCIEFLPDLSFADDSNMLATTIFKVSTARSTHCIVLSLQ